MNELIWRDSCDRVKLGWWWGLTRTMRSRSRSVEFLSFEPLHTFVSCKLEGEPCGSDNECSDVDKDVAVDSLSSKVEVFVGLDIESRHRSVTKYYKK